MWSERFFQLEKRGMFTSDVMMKEERLEQVMA